MLAVGGHVLGDLDPRLVRMTTGFAGGVGESKGEPGSCSYVVERAAPILLELLSEQRGER